MVVGEVGLAGEIRGVSQIDKRLSEVQRLGFKNMVLPKNSVTSLNRDHGLQLKGVQTVQEAISYLIQ